MENKSEKEVLLRTIDVLTMDVLRLKSENETLRILLDKKNTSKGGPRSGRENMWSRGLDYLRREGVIKTLKKLGKTILRNP